MNSVEYIYYSLIITGILIIIITTGLSSIIGYIVGYSFICAGFLLLLGYLSFKLNGNSNFFSVLTNIGPIIAIVGILAYYISILGIYKTRITDGNIVSGYYSFSNLFLILILIQSYVFYKALQDKQFKQTNAMDKVSSMVLYLLSVISILVVISIHIILAYFTTDG
jgi:hypothetical protein